jgi:hypothetical protein
LAPTDVDQKQYALAQEVEKARARRVQPTGKTAVAEAAAEEGERGKCQLEDELTMQPSAEEWCSEPATLAVAPWSVLPSMEEEAAVEDSWMDEQMAKERREATEESAPWCARWWLCRRVEEGKSAGMGGFKCGKRDDAIMLTQGFQNQLARRNERTVYIQARQKPRTVLACPLSHSESVKSDRQKVTTPGIVKLADEQSRWWPGVSETGPKRR